MEIESVVEICLTGLFKSDVFNKILYLKGGQAIRLKENIKTRFSADIDFSVASKITDSKAFELKLFDVLHDEFLDHDLHLFDFKFVRRPKEKKDGTPDFWGGWQVSFKLVPLEKETQLLEKKRREAIVPVGAPTSIVSLDISEYEYCESTEKVKIKAIEVQTYSRVLLVLEKIRALCQQHPDYKYKGEGNRGRDYYDIERLWDKVLSEKKQEEFLAECSAHIKGVFKAKGVEIELLKKIFESSFTEVQKSGWRAVQTTVSGKLQSFEYYNETLKDIISKIDINE